MSPYSTWVDTIVFFYHILLLFSYDFIIISVPVSIYIVIGYGVYYPEVSNYSIVSYSSAS